MRRVSPTLLALAGFAALIAAPMVAGAQGTPPSANDTVSAFNFSCHQSPGTTVGSTTSAACTTPAPVDVTPSGSYTADAHSAAITGSGAQAHAEFNGNTGPLLPFVGSSADYFRYFMFDPNAGVATIEFTSNVTDSFLDAPGDAIESFRANLDFGLLNGDNSFQDSFDGATYNNSSSGGMLTYDLDVNDLGGASSFYYEVSAHAHVDVTAIDPWSFADVLISDPTVTFWDDNGDEIFPTYSYSAPITGTPEPASLVLMGTGLIGIAGAARRKRRAAV